MEQSRRTFLTHAGRLLVILPLGFATAEQTLGCGGGNECEGENSFDENPDQFIYTSSCAGSGSGHVHMFTIEKTTLATPPSAGLAGNTTPYKDDGHVHTVELTQADLESIQSGTPVTKTTGVTLDHSHQFTFRIA